MNRAVIERMYESMTNYDLKKYNPDAKIISYPNIYNYNTIDNLFGDSDKIIILYLVTALNNGHWVCLLRNKMKNTIYFFDSYGLGVDEEQKYVKNQYVKDESGQNHKYLKWLLTSSPYKIVENHIKLQGKNTFTCGRYCSLRLMNKHLSNDEFIHKYFFNTQKTPDIIVSELIK